MVVNIGLNYPFDLDGAIWMLVFKLLYYLLLFLVYLLLTEHHPLAGHSSLVLLDVLVLVLHFLALSLEISILLN